MFASCWRAASVCAAVAVIATGGAASAQSYDAFQNFALKQNPNGAWSYLVAGALLNSKIKICNNIKKDLCWWNDESEPDAASVQANKTGKTISWATITLPAKYLDLDPESNSDVAVVWTAPSAGTLKITGNFLGVDSAEASHAVAVMQNSTALWSNTISSYGQEEKFKLAVQVNAGDTISFVSSTSVWHNLGTGLQAKLVLN